MERNGITVRQWLPLLGITASAFIFNTSEFMPVGLLTDIGSSFALTESQAGIMITVYAWAVMLLSLPLMVAASRLEFKRLLLLVITAFGIGQFLSALAPSYPVLVLARLLVACAHAIFWSIASVIASRLVDVRHASLALSMVATGSSIAMIFGLPLGRAIGLVVGWRMTFTIVGIIAVGVVGYMGLVMPRVPAGDPFTLRRLPVLLHNELLVGMYVVTMLFATAYYTGYSYIEPFFQQIGHLDPATITVVLTVFGLAGLVGSVLFSRFYDRRRTGFILVSIAGMAVALLALQTSAWGIAPVVAICLVWGICGTVFNIAFQSEVIRHSDADDSAVAMSLFSGIFNLGIGAGSALGGQVVDRASIADIGLVGGALALGALAIAAMLVARPMHARGE